VFGYLSVIGIMGFIAGIVVVAPFFFTPDNIIFDIVSGSLADIVSALFIVMTCVFFLNNDHAMVKSEVEAVPSLESAVCAPQE
jgi:hypothetical protein